MQGEPRSRRWSRASGRIAELLVKRGLVTREGLAAAAGQLSEASGALTAKLVKHCGVSEDAMLDLLHLEYQLPIVDPAALDIAPEAIAAIPATIARKYDVVPVDLGRTSLTLAMADPSNLHALNEVKFLTGLDVRAVIARPSSIERAIERHYAVDYGGVLSELSRGGRQAVGGDPEVDPGELERATAEAPVVKLVHTVLADAVQRRASDVHIEPYERVLRVRFRIDGVLYEIMQPPLELKSAIASRIKVMASLDIAERRLPQDGRTKVRIAGGEIDLRVSTMPTLFGEKVVVRLLDRSGLELDLGKLGFEPQALAWFREAIARAHGMVLVTGPTGSGKTTSLYSALALLNRTDTNVSTAEDPIEYDLAGINQLQVHDDIGLTFAAALRAFLRQDPDVIMVGEIRDAETAEIAVKAALTGHLVLSTLHTNDAPSTIQRLLNMGVEPFLVASSANLIVAQRLVRVLCARCREPEEIPAAVWADLGMPAGAAHPEPARAITAYRGAGCPHCGGTGFRGRTALYETMRITEEMRELIASGASASEIKRQAMRDGMQTLRQAGLAKVRLGLTTVEEILRLTAAD
jgi:type IV pilus assembly protein PilB